jgi:hypothetical protein
MLSRPKTPSAKTPSRRARRGVGAALLTVACVLVPDAAGALATPMLITASGNADPRQGRQ